ncbi:phosphoribosyltransferase family protein [Carboxydochorda subterranea]|uniref:Phosphoribosyltransferase family protein n=1 Tax=Carboxydichorda subterranea TaxID=3109565 RepID=A0ABZ1BWD1_9FIRM|nr:phosphoribosyltransferase family protein [Limnochorda sp. L945t]WRP17109.1 phosphoribosyltransferase family protein [Limnochorda sp. L945t]
MRFADRENAGDRLAALLEEFRGTDALALGIPRGGVVVASRVATRLGLTLGAVSVKKVPCPFNPELAVGAVAADGTELLNEEAVRALSIGPDELRLAVEAALDEARRREAAYGCPIGAVSGRRVLIVDDGLATGYTAIAAVRYATRHGAESVTVAVPVAARSSARMVATECRKVVAVTLTDELESVGQWYDDFRPVDDQHVLQLLRPEHPQAGPGA